MERRENKKQRDEEDEREMEKKWRLRNNWTRENKKKWRKSFTEFHFLLLLTQINFSRYLVTGCHPLVTG
jgi:hypothetical protein